MYSLQEKLNAGSIGGWVIATLLFIADRYVKLRAYSLCPEEGCSWLHINTTVFGVVPVQGSVIIVGLVAGIAALAWGFFSLRTTIAPPVMALFDTAFGLLFLGAMSNMVDRVWVGGVIDYLRVAQTVYNGADMMIAVGVIGMIIVFLYYGNNSLKRGGQRS